MRCFGNFAEQVYDLNALCMHAAKQHMLAETQAIMPNLSVADMSGETWSVRRSSFIAIVRHFHAG